MSQQKHTPTPWKAKKREYGIMIFSSDGSVGIAGMVTQSHEYGKDYPEEAQANAEFIVDACNSHDDFLKALELIAAKANLPIGSQQEEMSTRLEMAAIASRAINAAKGGAQ
jgi:hypothetical protein